ncbi:MAG TPA: four-carbon acid sugar kinase family protein [Bryobacteraceae bacterium]|nr:four-carbon acid sugar kinase family protein [Bryobacteraceae bacterium]
MTPLFTWYGDDFTGSTDSLEVLASAGLDAVLFLDPPDAAQLARFRHCRAIGIAGESRSRDPQWMDDNLPGVFENLRQLGAPLCQYKVCSTFDSAPHVGNIGRALEIGQRIFGNPWVPLAVGAPHLRRYVVFGNLFAVHNGQNYRIDRHPTMSRHPVTPMDESDLRAHLARQTALAVGHLDLVALLSGNPDAALDAVLAANPAAVLFDGMFDDSLLAAGRLIWNRRPASPAFCVGSSGLTHSLMLHWREAGIIPRHFDLPQVSGHTRMAAISGSCSPVTEAQLHWAMTNGYAAIRIDPDNLDLATPLAAATEALNHHPGVILYTAMGTADLNGAAPRGETLGRHLGTLLREVIRRTGIRRAAVAGGDTASHAVRQLGIDALTFAGPLAPGSPLCRASSSDPAIDGLEITLKGGQVGSTEFFDVVRKGRL